MQWFEREFQFPFPVDVYPGVVERLRGLVPRVEHLARAHPPAAFTRRVDGTWTAQENLGHLYDLEELWDGRIDDFLAGAPVLRPADVDNRKTHAAGHDDRPLDEVVGQLVAARRAQVARLERLAPADYARTARHPRLDQPMRLIDSLYFQAEHDDHHLARVHTLLHG